MYTNITGTSSDNSIYRVSTTPIQAEAVKQIILDFWEDVKEINALSEKEQIKRINDGEADTYLLILNPTENVTAVFQAKFQL
jgi:hypothetical protein